jgi:hypothetical protein
VRAAGGTPPRQRTARLAVFLAKWGAALALLFALTMPLTTCSIRHDLPPRPAYENGETLICFLAPALVLLLRSAWPRLRASYAMPVLECAIALFCWVWLTIGVVGVSVLTLFFISPGQGYDVASWALIGYFVLSVVEAAVLIRGERSHSRS